MPFKDADAERAYHRAFGRRWHAQERARRIQAGVCPTCRTPVQLFRQCLECRQKRAAYYVTVERPKLQKKALRCKDCRKGCVRPGASRCGSCSAKYANAVRWQRTREAAA